MRLPQVSERVKEAPAQALRGVFAGIGQLLLITDKLRNKTPADQQVPRARAPEPPAAVQDPGSPAASASPIPPAEPVPAPPPEPAPSADPAPAPPAEPVLETRDLDKTGNVRLLIGEKAGTGDTAPTVDAMTTGDDAAAADGGAGAGDALTAEEAGPAPETTASAPLPNYDELSIASLRARLRYLDVAQLRQLLVYEQAHAARPDVMAMFERRIAKLQSESADERGEAEAEAEMEAQEDVDTEEQDDVEAEAEGET
jgi:hypothetical protein